MRQPALSLNHLQVALALHWVDVRAQRGEDAMTLDAQVLVVAFVALLLDLIVECSKRAVVETGNLQHWRNLSGRECGLPGVQGRTRPSDSVGQISTAADSKVNG